MKLFEIMRPVVMKARRVPQTLVLEHAQAIGIVALMLGFAAAAWLVTAVFVLEPAVVAGLVPEKSEKRLATDTIDHLELWIETVEDERRLGFPTPPGPIFVIEDLPPEP